MTLCFDVWKLPLGLKMGETHAASNCSRCSLYCLMQCPSLTVHRPLGRACVCLSLTVLVAETTGQTPDLKGLPHHSLVG